MWLSLTVIAMFEHLTRVAVGRKCVGDVGATEVVLCGRRVRGRRRIALDTDVHNGGLSTRPE